MYYSIFCSTLNCSITFIEFRSRAISTITSNSGLVCTKRKLVEESSKHARMIDTYIKKHTLRKTKVYHKIKQEHYVLKQTSNGPITEASQIKKFRRKQANLLILAAIGRATGEYVTAYSLHEHNGHRAIASGYPAMFSRSYDL